MAKQKPTFPSLVGWYIEPVERPVWDGMVLDRATGELVKEPSMTKQSFKEECDINNIVRRFEATGIVDHLNQKAREGVYTDLPDPVDFQGALEIARVANDAFSSLPADLRARFNNDPLAFLEFTANPDNQQELINLGLATDNRPPPEPGPQKVEIVNPTPPVKDA